MNIVPERQTLTVPGGHDKILLHSCCAPCSGEVMEALAQAGIDFTVFFYNPNIQPRREYELRKSANKNFAVKNGIVFVDADYDSEEWFARARGMEYEPERGKRCTMCFDMRLARTALYAHEHGFSVFATSLGISRHKDLNQVNDCGARAAEPYPGLIFWAQNWRKKGGSERMITIAKRENFYRQEYCGCIYSLRDGNAERRARGLEPVCIGGRFYGKP